MKTANFISCFLLVLLSYYFADRAIVDYVYQHQFNHYLILKNFTEISGLLIVTAPFFVVISLFTYKLDYISKNKYFTTLFLCSWSVLAAECIKVVLKIIFGRYWPDTWTHHNPSWIHDHAYGFHWFHWGSWYGSFPSGHTMVVFAFMSVIWFRHPPLRPFAMMMCGLVMIGLLGMNYHFLSDIIAGALIGSVIGHRIVKVKSTSRVLKQDVEQQPRKELN